MDIDYYNANNPTTPWGWRVPTQADFNTLTTTLGGASVAGGKMKMTGTTYWNSPNTGADNSSGFSAIGTGWRNINGAYVSIKAEEFFYNINGGYSVVADTRENIITSSYNIVSGFSLRLIKSTT